MFNLDGMNHGGSFRIKYQDDEGDLVSVTDDEELQAAFALAKGWDARTPFRMEIFRRPSSPHNRGFPKPKPLNPPIVQVTVEEPIVVQQKGADAELPSHQQHDQGQDQDHGKDEPQHQEPEECQWGRGRHGGRYCGRAREQGLQDLEARQLRLAGLAFWHQASARWGRLASRTSRRTHRR